MAASRSHPSPRKQTARGLVLVTVAAPAECDRERAGTSVTGVRCPACAAVDDKVIDSRTTDDGSAIRRRRECLTCGRRFTTFERYEEALPTVVKRSGDRVPF